MTHYETLGVGENAGPDEIKKAYRKLASQHHPDKGGDTAMFQKVEEAYRILSDPQKREHYDLERQGGFQGMPGGMPHDIHDIFRNFGFSFNGHDPFAQMRQQYHRRNRDIRVEINMPLADTLQDQSKPISVQTGTGERVDVQVNIPRGVTSGSNIRYGSLGDNSIPNVARGDLYVQINVVDNPKFQSNGLDLYTRISVNCLLAIVGGDIVVDGLDGKSFVITLPAGTQPGVKFRIANQGLYQLNSDQRGHLYAELAVTIPQNLTEEQKLLVHSLINT